MGLDKNLGLVLTSGGARGAYQAGALRAIAEITRAQSLPFSVLSGVSAGSINASFLASRASDFQDAAASLSKFWRKLNASEVFRTDRITLTKTGLAWLSHLGLGGRLSSDYVKSLLVTTPLKNLLTQNISFQQIQSHLNSGQIKGLAITATNYYSGTVVTFYDGAKGTEPWIRTTRMAVRAPIQVDHVMASSAIPVFFPAIEINGAYYGDGCIRMNTPLSPAIHMGASKILAIGVRHERSLQRVNDLNRTTPAKMKYPLLAEVGGVLLNAIFLDALESDVERIERINQTLSMISKNIREQNSSQLRHVPVMVLKPSRDLGALVTEVIKDFSFSIRHLLKGLGATDVAGWDLLSYLAFDSAYTSRLEELGYEDTLASKDALLEFL